MGGFEGEAKSEMYRQLPQSLCPATTVIQAREKWDDVVEKISSSGLQYPFIVKPDVGAKGILFRKINSEQQLQAYHRVMPATYLVQEYLPHPYEISVFYIRKPNQPSGAITAIIRKVLPEIVGDGKSTIAQLMAQHRGAATQLKKLKVLQQHQLNVVLPRDKRLVVSEIANLYNGAVFSNHTHECTPGMLQLFDDISHRCKFYYGRYDIRCHSIHDLESGKFKILEFNGAGSVANHVFTGKYTLLEAYKEILKHWKLLYEISRHNHQHGYRCWSFWKGLRFFWKIKKHFNRLKAIDRKLRLPDAQPATPHSILLKEQAHV